MYRNKVKTSSSRADYKDTDVLQRPCVNLGTRISLQIYSGVDSQNSTLITGEYDDPESWEVDPACDMSTDRFGVALSEPIPSKAPLPAPAGADAPADAE